MKKQWNQILRLLCSIKLKEIKASEILKRLSSYLKQHPLYKSLKELGRIYKSIFLLRYLNETLLRQQIEKQLNKVEHSHNFAKAIYFGINQEFKASTKEEQEVALSSRHLIQNSIVLWNYLFVTEKLKMAENRNEFNNLIKSLKTSSMMTWKHINLLSEYDFDISKTDTFFDIQSLLDFNIEKLN